jgi:hypothetical protein
LETPLGWGEGELNMEMVFMDRCPQDIFFKSKTEMTEDWENVATHNL